MPRNVRNYWINVQVDGKGKPIEAGPKAAGGGFRVSVLLRHEGSISPISLEVTGQAYSNGKLQLIARVDEPGLSFEEADKKYGRITIIQQR